MYIYTQLPHCFALGLLARRKTGYSSYRNSLKELIQKTVYTKLVVDEERL
jgi:hypothetical protein